MCRGDALTLPPPIRPDTAPIPDSNSPISLSLFPIPAFSFRYRRFHQMELGFFLGYQFGLHAQGQGHILA
jgi:hypothetical protein